MAKTFTGIISSDKANKTIVVTVRTRKTHPIYKKQYTVSKKFIAHDEQNEGKIGDRVVISETRPISARKRFVLSKVAERAAIRHEEPEETFQPKPTKSDEEPAETKPTEKAEKTDKKEKTEQKEKKV